MFHLSGPKIHPIQTTGERTYPQIIPVQAKAVDILINGRMLKRLYLSVFRIVIEQAFVFGTYPQGAIITFTDFPYTTAEMPEIVSRIELLEISPLIRAIVHSTEIRPYPHAVLLIAAERINGIVRQCIRIILVGNGQMGNLVIRQIVNIQAGLCAHPQLVVRFELQSPHIGVQQLPRLACSLIYLCQPVQRSDIHAVMGSADLPVDNIILENLISFRILERLQRSFKVSFRIVKIIRIQGQPTRIPIQPKAGYIGQSRIVQMVQQPPFIRFIAEQPLVFYRYPDIIVLVTSNHGDEIPDDIAVITGLIESGKGIQYRVVNKDSPIGTNPDISPAVLVERSYEILA